MKYVSIIKSLTFISTLCVPLVSFGGSADFLVEMKVVENGVELATPRILAKEGSEASMSLSGENPVAVGLVVSNHNESQAHVITEIEISGTQVSPELVTQKGEWASVSVGELEFHILVDDHVANQ